MPFFRYAATDPQGKAVQGTVQATTPDEVARSLEQRGFKLTAILDPGAKHAIPAAVQPVVPSAPPFPYLLSASFRSFWRRLPLLLCIKSAALGSL
jgi:hypothetical protein